MIRNAWTSFDLRLSLPPAGNLHFSFFFFGVPIGTFHVWVKILIHKVYWSKLERDPRELPL